ncbi:MAG: InlB B-repeat-containing protein [Lachnospiraceae bacterium]|nr:InlB B-repeat-containing protein [Lachnospiraceae bacterium]
MSQEGKVQQKPDEVNKRSKKLLLIILCAVLVIAGIVAAVLFLNGKNKLSAVVIRLIERDGTVAMQDEKGSARELLDNMRLNSGSLLSTGSDGLLKLDMDTTKIVTMVEDSRLAVKKDGKALALDLLQGSLLFNVTEKLNDDESFDISTSTMLVGIRGTSAWIDSNTGDVYLLDGKLHITGTNPNTGATKEIEIVAGQHVHVYLFDDKVGDDSVDFFVENVSPHDLPERLRQLLRQDPELEPLRKRILEDTGWVPEEFDDWLFPEDENPVDTVEEPTEPEEEPGVTYGLTWIIDGSVMSGGDYPDSYVYGEGLAGFPSPAKEGYTFDGWYEDADLTTSADAIGKGDEGDRTFFGTWIEDGTEIGETYSVLYTVTGLKSFNAGEFKLVTSYVSGEETALVKPEKPGYTFDGWYADEGLKQSVTAISEEEVGNIRLYGKFIPMEFKISYAVDGIASFDAAGYGMPMTYKVGSEIDIPSPSIWGYDFYGWYTDNTMKEAVSTLPEDTVGDIGLYGIAVKTADEKTHNIFYVVEGIQGFNPGDYGLALTYTEGVGSGLTIPSIPGYTFDGWYADAGRTTPISAISAAEKEDVTVYGVARSASYTISYQVAGMGSFDPAAYNLPTTYTAGTAVALSVPQIEGRTLDGWYSDGARTQQITEISATSTGNVTVYGRVTNNTYNIIYSIAGLNAFDPLAYNLPVTYTYGTAVDLSVPAIAGYDFNGWYSDAGLTTSLTRISATQTGDVTCYGQVTGLTFGVTYTVTGITNFDAAAYNLPSTYTAGTATALPQPTSTGYDFDCWYTDANLTMPITEIPADSRGDLTLYGSATARTFGITYTQMVYELGQQPASSQLALNAAQPEIAGVAVPLTFTYSETTDTALPALNRIVQGTGNNAATYTYYMEFLDQNSNPITSIPAGTDGDVEIFVRAYVLADAMNQRTEMLSNVRVTNGVLDCRDANGNGCYVDLSANSDLFMQDANGDVHLFTAWNDTTLLGAVTETGGIDSRNYTSSTGQSTTGLQTTITAYSNYDAQTGALTGEGTYCMAFVFTTANPAGGVQGYLSDSVLNPV